jgi:hypothetical protein
MPRPRSYRSINIRELTRAQKKLDDFLDNIGKVAMSYDAHKEFQLAKTGMIPENTQYMLDACEMLGELVKNGTMLISLMIAEINRD